MKYYLGVIGTAKTSYVAVSNLNGEIIKLINAPPLSIKVNSDFLNSFSITIGELCRQLDIKIFDFIKNIESACISMSGVFFKNDEITVTQILEQLGFWGDFPIIICEDVNANLAANFLDFGGVVVASTGSNVFFRLPDGEIIRIDGWGSDLGDEGSGYYLGRLCIRSILMGKDGRKKRSAILENHVLKFLHLSSVEDLVQWFYNSRKTVKWRSDLSDLAIPLLMAAEEKKDTLSISIVNSGIKALQKSLIVAMEKSKKQLTSISEPFPIILEGGLFEHSKLYKENFKNLIAEFNNQDFTYKAVDPNYFAVIGSLALAISNGRYINNEIKILSELQESAKKLGYFFQKRWD